MSSILKALKKIETDAPPPEEFTSWPKKIDTKTAINSGARKRWYYRRLASYFLTGLVILAIGVLIFSQREFISTRILPAGKHATPEASSQASNSNGIHIFRAKIDTNLLSKTDTQPRRSVKKPSGHSKSSKRFSAGNQSSRVSPATRPQRDAAATAPPVKKVRPVARVKKTAPRKTPLQPVSKPSTARRQATARSSNTAPPKRKMPAASKTEVKYSLLRDAAVQLQAIAWSQEAAKRLAVINGRILREGESVDGYTLTQIRQEGVIVNDGSKTWLIEFGLKQ